MKKLMWKAEAKVHHVHAKWPCVLDLLDNGAIVMRSMESARSSRKGQLDRTRVNGKYEQE